MAFVCFVVMLAGALSWLSRGRRSCCIVTSLFLPAGFLNWPLGGADGTDGPFGGATTETGTPQGIVPDPTTLSPPHCMSLRTD